MPKLSENLPKNLSKEDSAYLKKYAGKLSDSSQYAQWISSLDDKPDHDGQSLMTRNHDVIQRWAEERGAVPATVEGTEHDDRAGVLRFDFPGYGGDRLQEISWDEWFQTFDERELVFVYQEKLKSGDQSNFFRFDNPHREDA